MNRPGLFEFVLAWIVGLWARLLGGASCSLGLHVAPTAGARASLMWECGHCRAIVLGRAARGRRRARIRA